MLLLKSFFLSDIVQPIHPYVTFFFFISLSKLLPIKNVDCESIDGRLAVMLLYSNYKNLVF